eukprot:1805429-Pleurochrysis_carterae.AAC.7
MSMVDHPNVRTPARLPHATHRCHACPTPHIAAPQAASDLVLFFYPREYVVQDVTQAEPYWERRPCGTSAHAKLTLKQ